MEVCHAIKNLLLWSYMRKRTSYGGGGERKGAGNGKKKVEEGCREWSPNAADSGPGEEKCCCSLHPWLRTCMGFEVRPHSEVKTNLLTGHVTLDKSPYFFECRFLYPKLRIERVTLLIKFNLILKDILIYWCSLFFIFLSLLWLMSVLIFFFHLPSNFFVPNWIFSLTSYIGCSLSPVFHCCGHSTQNAFWFPL